MFAISNCKLLKYLKLDPMKYFRKHVGDIFYDKTNCELLKSFKNLETLILKKTNLSESRMK